MIIQGTTIYGGRLYDKSAGLYPFTTFTFNNDSVWNRTGPTINQLKNDYGNATFTWLDNTSYYNVSSGIQLWTVPLSGTYRITAYGAQGAPTLPTAGGVGAIIQGDFTLTEGEKIKILVGTSANIASARLYRDSPGGGGTFVVKDTVSQPTTSDILVIAGGGGGTGSAFISNANANVGTSGKTAAGSFSFNGVGGTNGNGGGQSTGATANGAGGGFTGNGASNGGTAGGIAFIFGGFGGAVNSTYAPGGGGFGGGGAPNNGDLNRFAGGGGYSGGGASDAIGSGPNSTVCGGGGGSYNNGSNQINQSDAQGNFGNGKVIITKI